jgi:hypothetical protein
MMAGAHLDDEFAAQAVDEVLLQDRRAVAPSYGCDAVPVLRECVRSQARRFLRDVVVCFSIFVCIFNALYLILTWIFSATAWLFARGVVDWRQQRSGRVWSGAGIWWRTLAVYLLCFWLFTFIGVILIELVASPTGDSFDAETGTPVIDNFFAIFFAFSSLIFLIIIPAVIFLEAILRWQSLRDLGRQRQASSNRGAKGPTGAFEEWVLKHFAARLDHVGAAQYGNVTVYRGFQPFVGSGKHVYTWSTAIELMNDDGTPATHAFTPQDLYDRVTEGVGLLRNIGTAQGQQPIQALQIVDRFFVAGDALRANPETSQLLRDAGRPPSQYIDPASSQRLVNSPPERVRHYRCFRIDGWQGEVVTTIFLHAARDGRMLYLEFNLYVLFPVKSRYYLVDWFGKAPTGSLLSVLWPAAKFCALAPILAFTSLYRTVRVVVRRAAEHVIDEGGLEQPSEIDFGAAVGVRDLAARQDFGNYFQLLDSDKYLSIVERRVLESVGSFLRECGISTREFAERKTTILNSSIQVLGGNFQGATSIGHGSRAAQTGPVPEREK